MIWNADNWDTMFWFSMLFQVMQQVVGDSALQPRVDALQHGKTFHSSMNAVSPREMIQICPGAEVARAHKLRF